MVTKHFHIEHADGKRWTDDELTTAIATDQEIEDGTHCYEVVYASDGSVYLLDNWFFWHYAIPNDMVVVWDE